MRHNSVPGHIYNVDVETTNADIPYADTFCVLTHYCLVKVSDSESFLTVLCDIKYKKTPWGLVKSFIEKNCWAGIDEHYTALSNGEFIDYLVFFSFINLIKRKDLNQSLDCFLLINFFKSV